MTLRKRLTVLTLAAVSTLFAFAAARPQTPAWKPLFNGKDLTGWKHVGPGNMTVDDGLIHTHGGMRLLYWSGSKLRNSRLRLVDHELEFHANFHILNPIPLAPREEFT